MKAYRHILNHLATTHRGFIAMLIVIAVMITGDPTLTSLLVGMLITSVGVILRIWTAGYGYKEGSFALRGPYYLVRHPYFLGTGLFYFGLCLAGRNFWVTAVSMLILSLGFRDEVARDEEQAAHTLGPVFKNYKARIPAFFPQFLPPSTVAMPAGETARFSLRSAVLTGRHRELDALLIMLFAFGLLYGYTQMGDKNLYHISMLLASGLFIIGRIIFFKLNPQR